MSITHHLMSYLKDRPLLSVSMLCLFTFLISVPNGSSAASITMTWNGWFVLMNMHGDSLFNSSIPVKLANQYITPISGTLTYDEASGTGTMTFAPFDYQSNPPEAPFQIHSASFISVDNIEQDEQLLLGNMFYDWNGNTNVSFSIVWDGRGLIDGIAERRLQITGGSASAVDDTFAYAYAGGSYIQYGPIPLATTSYDTTNVMGCEVLDCLGVLPSGTLPLIVDASYNRNKSDASMDDIYGVSGTPIMDSGFQYKSINLDITSFNIVAIDGVATDISNGDMNEDQKIDTSDLVIMEQVVKGRLDPTELQTNRGDLIDDDELDVADLSALLSLILDR